MAINISQDFKRTSAAPIDATLVLTKAEMLAVDDNLMPDKYFAVCKDDGKFYIYDKSATAGAETGKFSVLEGGGGGDAYTLPPATASTLGGVKIGDGVTVDTDGTISVDAGGDDQDINSVLAAGNTAKNKTLLMRNANGDATSHYVNVSEAMVSGGNPTTNNTFAISGSQVLLTRNGATSNAVSHTGMSVKNAAGTVQFEINANSNTCTIGNTTLKNAMRTALGITDGTTYTAGDGIDITNDEISVTFATDEEIDTMLTNIFGA